VLCIAYRGRDGTPRRPQFRKKAEWEPKKTVGLEDMVLVSKISDDNIVDNIKKRYNEDLIYVRKGHTIAAPAAAGCATGARRLTGCRRGRDPPRTHARQTYIGPILIAVNPYKSLPYFTQAEIETYNGCVRGQPGCTGSRLAVDGGG